MPHKKEPKNLDPPSESNTERLKPVDRLENFVNDAKTKDKPDESFIRKPKNVDKSKDFVEVKPQTVDKKDDSAKEKPKIDDSIKVKPKCVDNPDESITVITDSNDSDFKNSLIKTNVENSKPERNDTLLQKGKSNRKNPKPDKPTLAKPEKTNIEKSCCSCQ